MDLTLLLLIAFTQISYDPEALDLDFGEIEVAEIQSPVDEALANRPGRHWQLRVHPLERGSGAPPPPFELIEIGPELLEPASPAARIGASSLQQRLATLRDERAGKPLLVPDRDSRSEDLLIAIGFVEQLWSSARGAAVAVPPAVSAPPPAAAPISPR